MHDENQELQEKFNCNCDYPDKKSLLTTELKIELATNRIDWNLRLLEAQVERHFLDHNIVAHQKLANWIESRDADFQHRRIELTKSLFALVLGVRHDNYTEERNQLLAKQVENNAFQKVFLKNKTAEHKAWGNWINSEETRLDDITAALKEEEDASIAMLGDADLVDLHG